MRINTTVPSVDYNLCFSLLNYAKSPCNEAPNNIISNHTLRWPMPKTTYSTLNFMLINGTYDVAYRYCEYRPQADCFRSNETSFTEPIPALGCIKFNTDIKTTQMRSRCLEFSMQKSILY